MIRSTLVAAALGATLAGIVTGACTAVAAPQTSVSTAIESARAALEAKQSTLRVAPAQLLVKFPDGTPVASIRRAALDMGGSLISMVTPDGLAKVRVDPFVDVRDAMRRWKERPDVQYAAPNVIAHVFATPNDTTIATYDLKWNLRQVGAFDAWDYVTADPRIVVAIVDSGVAFEDYPIPAYEIGGVWPGTTMYLRSPELPGPFVPGWDFVNNDAHPDDDFSHGTFVATLLAGAANNVVGSCGVAFGVTIMPVKVIDFQGDAESDNIVQGIRFAADHGATIMNLSLGYPPIPLFLQSGYTLQQIADIVNPLGDAIAYAQNKGCLIVASAGNFAYPEVSYPAAFPGVIACGGTGVDGSRSSFSSWGKDLDFMAPGGEFLDVNNDHIQDAVPAYSMKPNRSPGSLAKPDSFGLFFSFGTSESAPHVAGAAALLMSAG
ncbi:MAG: S8 family serine peptidase, partial [Candidatus Eiseniibacteriota bacterium]